MKILTLVEVFLSAQTLTCQPRRREVRPVITERRCGTPTGGRFGTSGLL